MERWNNEKAKMTGSQAMGDSRSGVGHMIHNIGEFRLLPITPSLVHSNIPLFHYSIIPVFS
jgi:hypothetical protein